MNPFDPNPPFDAPTDISRYYEQQGLAEPIFDGRDLEVHESLTTHFTQQSVPQRPGKREMCDKASDYAMVEVIDRAVGRLLTALERTNQRENTIFIFTSDYGELLEDHGLQLKGCRFYEGLVRVPLILPWPARVQQGVQSDAPVELTDMAPTLAEITGSGLPWTHRHSLMTLLCRWLSEFSTIN